MKKAAVPSILVAVVLLALGVIAEAQQPKKVSRIAFVIVRRIVLAHLVDAFVKGYANTGT